MTPAAPPADTSPAPPSRLRRIMRASSRLLIGAVFVIGAGFAATYGAAALREAASGAPEAEASAAMPVAVARAQLVPALRVEKRHLGIMEAARETRLAFDRAGTLDEVLVDEGAEIRAGQVIARLDSDRLQARIAELEAQRDALEAQSELSRLTLDRQEKLRERGFATDQRWDEARLQLAQIKASIAQIDAGLTSARIDLDRSELRAPFAGRLAARMMDEGAIVAAGAAVAELIETDRPRIRVGLPAEIAAALGPGDLVEAELDGQRLVAAVAAVRPDLDPATRTRGVLLDILAPPDLKPAYGRAVEVITDATRREPGFWLPLAALREGEKGLWTVLVAAESDGGHVARPEAVEIMHVQDGAAFVRGTLQDGALVVTAGAHKLAPGLRLAPQTAPGDAAPVRDHEHAPDDAIAAR